jgi:peptidoglycan hydrolase-like protein with peptidoglycan-binding domain
LKKTVWIEILTLLCAGALLFAATTTPPATPKKKAKKASSAAAKKTIRRKPTVASWRSTQKAPTPERYKEIQQALASKGYLQSPSGVWDNSSVEALKKFQADQNLEPSGKLDSLSLIGLGLGPKRDQQPVPQP